MNRDPFRTRENYISLAESSVWLRTFLSWPMAWKRHLILKCPLGIKGHGISKIQWIVVTKYEGTWESDRMQLESWFGTRVLESLVCHVKELELIHLLQIFEKNRAWLVYFEGTWQLHWLTKLQFSNRSGQEAGEPTVGFSQLSFC